MHELRDFVDGKMRAHLSSAGDEEYPGRLVGDLRAMGLFSAGLDRSFGGLAFGPAELNQVAYELARGWQSLAGLLGSHYRACACLAACGTAPQKALFLGEVVQGSAVFAYAHKEHGLRDPRELRTRVVVHGGTGLLNGTKHWVTNGNRATHVMVIAGRGDGAGAVVVDPRRHGVTIGDELGRPGMRGVSLTEVDFVGYEFDPVLELVGGQDCDIGDYLRDTSAHSSLAFAARSVASAEALTDWLLESVKETVRARPPEVRGLISLRVGELTTSVFAMRGAWLKAVETRNPTHILRAKVFCSSTLQRVIELVAALSGGRSYAGPDQTVGRHYRDALALQLIDTPNDVLLGRIGSYELGLDSWP